MESKEGSVLLLIGGILTIVASFAFLLILIFLSFYGASFLVNTPGRIGSGVFITVLFVGLFLFLLVAGILKIYASKMMRDSDKTLNAGILGLVLGVFTSDILSIIGGIFGIINGSK